MSKALAPIETREVMGDFLEKEGFTVGAELGVQQGVFSLMVLNQWKSCKKYILVDAWAHQVRGLCECRRACAVCCSVCAQEGGKGGDNGNDGCWAAGPIENPPPPSPASCRRRITWSLPTWSRTSRSSTSRTPKTR